jgi:hypothetical protein
MPTFDYFIQSPEAPEFAAIRSRLALAFVEHKAEIGASAARDDDIVDNVDKISAILMAAFLTACIDGRREAFVEPFGWFVDIVAEVLDDVPRKLDS